jgi:hypothetical protein
VRRTAVWCGAPTACLKSRNHHSKITGILDIAVARRPTLFIIEIKENTECLWKLFSAKLKSVGDVRPVHLPGRWTTSTTRGCRNRVRARALSDQYTGWWHEQPAGMVPYGQGRRHRGADLDELRRSPHGLCPKPPRWNDNVSKKQASENQNEHFHVVAARSSVGPNQEVSSTKGGPQLIAMTRLRSGFSLPSGWP